MLYGFIINAITCRYNAITYKYYVKNNGCRHDTSFLLFSINQTQIIKQQSYEFE